MKRQRIDLFCKSESRRIKSLALLLALGFTGAQAQTMGLQDCIDYALSHNLSIQKLEINRQTTETYLNDVKSSYLPEASASVGQSWSFGRTTSEDSNSFSSNNSSYTSFGLSAGMPLFTGFRVYNSIKSGKYSVLAATANLDKARKDIGIQVAGLYLNALYYRGLTDVKRHKVELDSTALERAHALYESGKKPASEVATAEAQLAVSKHSLTESLGNEILARLELMQALNMEGDVQSFHITELDTTSLSSDVTSADAIFSKSVETYPSILAAKYTLESNKYDLKAAKSGYMPTLSLHAGYNTSYQYMYNYNGHYTNMAGQDVYIAQKSFGKQMTDHAYKSIGLSLNIPLFDRFSTRNKLKRSRLDIESQNLALLDAEQKLHKDIQQAYWNAVKARDNFKSAQKANASTSLAYQYEAERYAAGRGTTYELHEAANKMESCAQEEIQAKYELLMRLKILEFYNAE